MTDYTPLTVYLATLSIVIVLMAMAFDMTLSTLLGMNDNNYYIPEVIEFDITKD